MVEALDTGEEVFGEVWGAQPATTIEATIIRQRVCMSYEVLNRRRTLAGAASLAISAQDE